MDWDILNVIIFILYETFIIGFTGFVIYRMYHWF
jgi:hypothetical protein